MKLSNLRRLLTVAVFSSLLQVTLAARYAGSSSAAPSSAAPSSTAAAGALPTVDLGYEIQRATLYNSTGQFYNFSNIRYAAPPTGDLRFRAPQAPAVNRGSVQTGLPDRICAQASPAWELIAEQFLPLFFQGQTVFNESSFNVSTGGGLPPVDPRTTEDCLFLDVVVPKAIFDRAGTAGNGTGAPVMVWIYGGGYTAGSKSGSGNPAGLIARSELDNQPGIIYVSMNYRLGAFGFLSGPTFQEDGTANAGLYDQRFALEWVQKYISLFGGDPSRVTVFGESAGGGSIMHQITAFGGGVSVPFQQAITQSPGFQPFVSNDQQEGILDDFLGLLKVSSVEEARQLPFTTLARANTIQVGGSNYGGFTYGPTVDGVFAPALPGELLLHGQYDKNLKVMVGHNADEGILFTNPFTQNNTVFRQDVLTSLPTLAGLPTVLREIVGTLYPPIFDGSQAQNYTSQVARAAALTSELIFTCNTFYLDKAYGNNTYSYIFGVPPSYHGQDIPYTYFNGPAPGIFSPVALELQSYLTAFAETGTPNEAGVPFFPMYGPDATAQDLNITGISQIMDPAANDRCDFWQKALYY